ncbi:tRNA (cytidine(34)-2'-O)-methyltransferase [Nordella sp. HKS 07]|uniref:tRNA (cytidine(34)-2'-O)-methyltransferase n=1 Tax=Nordella sp. HKS 07 TaxID=2712222 RepID=UPI0013E1C741|nr:tRNA (cytidine(34)-2'-O)-methyltransferase [Nordella sp. HKS 07]QIG46455.1 tRNA (cytidine(34)-2'-O)-methyltransferase [Nordella sp. HKS 07]
MIEIALYQPDIPPNAATIMRMAACLGLKVRIIEPAGFTWSDSSLKRAGMDYLDHALVIRDPSWTAFREATRGQRLILASTGAAIPYVDFAFRSGDILLMGRESSGVPAEVHDAADARLLIPMRAGLRSLNVAMACAMMTGEALRQTAGFPAT